MSNTQGLSSKVIVRDSGIHGKGITLLNYNFKSSGWYALEDIKKGEIIYTPHPNSDKFDFHLSEILTWPKERRRKFFRISYQVDDEIYNGYHSDTEISEEQKLDWHLNHNCDPNVWYVKKDVVEARRDIKQGEELCYDYATTQSNDHMNMPCSCSAVNCRKFIKGDDWKLQNLQQAYGDHWLPFILKKINNSKSEQ